MSTAIADQNKSSQFANCKPYKYTWTREERVRGGCAGQHNIKFQTFYAAAAKYNWHFISNKYHPSVRFVVVSPFLINYLAVVVPAAAVSKHKTLSSNNILNTVPSCTFNAYSMLQLPQQFCLSSASSSWDTMPLKSMEPACLRLARNSLYANSFFDCYLMMTICLSLSIIYSIRPRFVVLLLRVSHLPWSSLPINKRRLQTALLSSLNMLYFHENPPG